MKRKLLAATLVAALAFIIATAAQAADKPNIVFILTYNLGYLRAEREGASAHSDGHA